MTSVSVHEAKTHLSRLIERVLAGEEVTVTRNKEPVIKLVPAVAIRTGSRIGTMKGQLNSDDEAMKSLPDEYLGLDLWDDKEL